MENESKDIMYMVINIEGADGVGKSTIAKRIVDKLNTANTRLIDKLPDEIKEKVLEKGIEDVAVYQHYPDYNTPMGQIIKQYLNGTLNNTDPTEMNYITASLLYVLDRRLRTESPDYKTAHYIINDRSFLSNFLYQGAKIVNSFYIKQQEEPDEDENIYAYLIDYLRTQILIEPDPFPPGIKYYQKSFYLRFPDDKSTLDIKEDKDKHESNESYMNIVSNMWKYLPFGDYTRANSPEYKKLDEMRCEEEDFTLLLYYAEMAGYKIDIIDMEFCDDPEKIDEVVERNVDNIIRAALWYINDYESTEDKE